MLALSAFLAKPAIRVFRAALLLVVNAMNAWRGYVPLFGDSFINMIATLNRASPFTPPTLATGNPSTRLYSAHCSIPSFVPWSTGPVGGLISTPLFL